MSFAGASYINFIIFIIINKMFIKTYYKVYFIPYHPLTYLLIKELNKKNIVSELKFLYSENNTLSIIFKNNEILILSNTINDEYAEVRKTLKSIGYIK